MEEMAGELSAGLDMGAPIVRDFSSMKVPDPKIDPDTLRCLAFDLLSMHIATGISLDNWKPARDFVEAFYGPVQLNGA